MLSMDFDVPGADGERVQARRERLGLDKGRLASDAGVSRDTLAAIERGHGFRRSSLTKIERVLEGYEVESGLLPLRAEVPAVTDLGPQV